MSESVPTPLTAAEDGGPGCETCGKTACPDADLPGFSDPVSCAYLPIYNQLRYDRCDYGCGRDITQASIRRDIVPTVDALLAAARADELERLRPLLYSEDAQAVLYGVTGTHPESYGGVTKDEALECAGELIEALRAALAQVAAMEVDQ